MNVLLVNNDSDSWQELQDAAIAAGYTVTPIHHSAIGAIDPRGYDLAILSGGWLYEAVDGSVEGAIKTLTVYAEELEFIRSTPIPILGICVGMQLMHIAVDQALPMLDEPQHGWKEININIAGQVMFGFPETLNVFKNHTNAIIETDPQFEELASSPSNAEIILHKTRPLLGVQFHPEIGENDDPAILLRKLVDGLMKIPVKLNDTRG